MTNDTTGLRTIVEAIIAGRQGDERLSPAAIATEALKKLGAADLELAAHLQLRQIARHACRKQFGRFGRSRSARAVSRVAIAVPGRSPR